ncbi:uncharacterized protein LOC127074770 isoform X2 [Lathyrus oleraceus]|uniref:Uncharacterized protein n=1 Tax=Pisum sativum TaxID=3888 RepID=A0A9D5ATL7_PEA|nr:uncharacterized protein LOC127074770 isoform X2 [Pisum sativum]KAI5418821.1 hypothetical protein KIW84_043160 [Pisum sativum]
MANIDKGSSKSLSRNHNLKNDVSINMSKHSVDSDIGRIGGEMSNEGREIQKTNIDNQNMKVSCQMEDLTRGSRGNRNKRPSKSDSAILVTKFGVHAMTSMGEIFLHPKRKLSEEEDEVTSKRVVLHNDISGEEVKAQQEVDIPLKDNIYAVEDQAGVGPSDGVKSDTKVNGNEAGEESESSCGIGNGKAKWINTFDLNELPNDEDVEEDKA